MSLHISNLRIVSIRVTALGIGDEAFSPIIAAALHRHADDILNGESGCDASGVQSMTICGRKVTFEWDAAKFEAVQS